MNNQINIAQILKDAPQGTKLYSPVCGECSLEEIEEGGLYPIAVSTSCNDEENEYLYFENTGQYSHYLNSECLLFPSKDCRTWENFKAPWKPDHKVFEPFQWVLVIDGGKWCAAIYSHYDGDGAHYIIGGDCIFDSDILPYKANEDKLGKEVEE